jgi:oligoribonuclease NrnB/cAMP/cGMP phosphodiesterase (DHH superfamily)
MIKPDICIYHGGCDDGFCAAWAVWRRWEGAVEFFPGIYGNDPPDIRGKHVLMVDFSYKRPVIDAMARAAASLTILDHHKTAQAELDGFEAWAAMEGGDGRVRNIRGPVKVVFDMGKSGARLAWEYCFGDGIVPDLVDLVEDRDLWRFKHGDRTRQFSAALRTYPQNFLVWNDLLNRGPELIAEGAIILRAHDANIQKFMADAFTELIGAYEVPSVNVPYHYASDAAHALLAKYPQAPFAAAWFKRGDGLIQYSLRSEDHRRDVSDIAKMFGGGGHRNAAGFQRPALFQWLDEASDD